jgi:hypothetical protein
MRAGANFLISAASDQPTLEPQDGVVKLNNRSAKSSRIDLWRRRQSLPGMQPFLVPKAQT